MLSVSLGEPDEDSLGDELLPLPLPLLCSLLEGVGSEAAEDEGFDDAPEPEPEPDPELLSLLLDWAMEELSYSLDGAFAGVS